MEKGIGTKIGAYFVIIIMIFSTFGFAVLFAPGASNSNNNSESVDTNNVDSPVNLPIKFSGIAEGEVTSFSKSFMLVADTNLSNIEEIDRSIKRIDGVSNVQSEIGINNSEDSISATIYKYNALVSGFSIERESFYNSVENIEGLTNIIVYPYNTVDIGGIVEFRAEDQNLTKDYDFGERKIVQVLSSKDTQIGDIISVYIDATFVGESIGETSYYELENITQGTEAE